MKLMMHYHVQGNLHRSIEDRYGPYRLCETVGHQPYRGVGVSLSVGFSVPVRGVRVSLTSGEMK